MKHLFVGLIKIWQHTFSSLNGNRCKYYPSCSNYALECFTLYNPFIALGKTVWRILRCNPFSKGGVDNPK